MKTKQNMIKTLILLPILVLVVFCGTMMNISSITANAYTDSYTREEVSIDDGNFANTSGTYPKSPTSMDEITATTSSSFLSGVIDRDSFSITDYGVTISDKPDTNSTDSHFLMLNAKTSAISYGYVTDDDITLSADSYYVVSVDIYSRYSEVGSVVITSDDFDDVVLDSNMTDSWHTLSFYINTSDYDDLDIQIELWIGYDDTQKGLVYFDNMQAYKITASDYYTQSSSTNTEIISLDENVISNNAASIDGMAPYSIDSTLSTDLGDADVTKYGILAMNGKTDYPPSDFYDDTYHALSIIHYDDSTTYYTTDMITIDSQTIVKYTTYITLANLESGTAYYTLTEVDEDGEIISDSTFTQSITISSTSNSSSNDYEAFSFYVRGDAIDTKYFTISFGLEEATGSMYASRYTESIIPYTVFNETTTSGGIAVVDFSSKYSTDSYIANAGFNLIDNDNTDASEMDNIYPSEPIDWTHTDYDEDKQFSGVISLLDSDYTTMQSYNSFSYISKAGGISGYNYDDDKNHVLMMGNTTLSYQSYTSQSVSLTANTTYVFSIYAYTNAIEGNAGISIVTSDDMALIEIDDINTSKSWKQYLAYVTVGDTAVDVDISLSLGNADEYARGSVYFDNILYSTTTSIPSSAEYSIDLSSDSYLYYDEQNILGMNTPVTYTGSNLGGYSTIYSGVLTNDNYNVDKFPSNTLNNPLSKTDFDTALVVYSLEDTYYEYRAIFSESFTSGVYYKVVISVYTDRLSQDSVNTNIDEDYQTVEYGASVSLAGFDDSFSAINTDGEWVDYTFYIAPSTDSTGEFVFSLGADQAYTSGLAVFGEPVITTFADYDTYIAELEDLYDDDDELPSNIVAITNNIPTDTDSDDTSSSNSLEILLYISSIITGLAVIVAILGVSLRKIKWKKRVKKNTEVYDRDITLLQQAYRKEASEIVAKDISDTESKISSLLSVKDNLEKEYKTLLSLSRELRMKNDEDSKKKYIETNKSTKSINNKLKKLSTELNKKQLHLEEISTEQYLYEYTNWLIRKTKATLEDIDNENNE